MLFAPSFRVSVFLECEAVFSIKGVFSEVGPAFTGVCFDIELAELPLLLVFTILSHAVWTFSHVNPSIMIVCGHL